MKLCNYKLPCHVDGLNKHVQYLLYDNELELHGWLTSSNMRFFEVANQAGWLCEEKVWSFFLMLGLGFQIIDSFFS